MWQMDKVGEKNWGVWRSVAGRAEHSSVGQQKVKEQQKDVVVTTISLQSL